MAVDGPAAHKGRQYYMLGGKGGVGKTSSAASLGVRLAAEGGATLVVSTDPAHSLSDSLDQVILVLSLSAFAAYLTGECLPGAVLSAVWLLMQHLLWGYGHQLVHTSCSVV